MRGVGSPLVAVSPAAWRTIASEEGSLWSISEGNK